MVVATRTISAHGTARRNLRPSSSTATEQTEISTAHPLSVESPPIRSATFPVKSFPESMLTPSIFASWLTMMSRARPPTNPTRIGLERKFARNPSLKTASNANMMPQMMAWASASVA